MNIPNYFSRFKIILFATFLSVQSCIPLLLIRHDAKPRVEIDRIKGIKRYKSTLHYRISEERNSGFIYNKQQLIKEYSAQSDEYIVFDYLKLNHRLDEIESTLYFVVDGHANPITIERQKSETLSEIDQNEEDVLLADSTQTTVITDYEIRYFTFIDIKYKISEELIRQIGRAEEVKIRYYAPPEMITLNLSKSKKKTFLELADTGQTITMDN